MDREYQSQERLTIIIMLFVVFLTIFSCHLNPQTSCRGMEKFNREKWSEVADLMSFPNRNCMVDDLVHNYNLKGKTLNKIIHLLGEPQYPIDSTMEIGYKVEEDFESDIDPVYTKILSIRFDSDTLVENVEIEEWKK
jgi:hypothetical protein